MYKPDHAFYRILLSISLIIVVLAYAIPSDWVPPGILSGIGTGAVSSVCVAWLIDIMNCKRRSKVNDVLMEKIFVRFDTGVQNEINTTLYECYCRDEGVDIDGNYTISEIIDFVDKADGKFPEWERHYHNLGVAFNSIEPSVLVSYDPTDKHAELYDAILQGIIGHANYNNIVQRYSVSISDQGDSFEYAMFQTDLRLIDQIYKTRGIDKKYDMGLWKQEAVKRKENSYDNPLV